MQHKAKRRTTARARRIIGIVAGLVVVAGSTVAGVAIANADQTPSAAAGFLPLPAAPKSSEQFKAPHRKVPANAKPATHGLAVEGARKLTFDPRVKKTNIVGGSVANAADYPGVVGIETVFWNFDAGAYYVSTCTGSVLSPTRILTAAHCSVDMPSGWTQVFAGRNDINNDTNGFGWPRRGSTRPTTTSSRAPPFRRWTT